MIFMAKPKPISMVTTAPGDYVGRTPKPFNLVGELPAGEQGPQGPEGPQGPAGQDGADGADGFGTEAQYNDIISRLEALEALQA